MTLLLTFKIYSKDGIQTRNPLEFDFEQSTDSIHSMNFKHQSISVSKGFRSIPCESCFRISNIFHMNEYLILIPFHLIYSNQCPCFAGSALRRLQENPTRKGRNEIGSRSSFSQKDEWNWFNLLPMSTLHSLSHLNFTSGNITWVPNCDLQDRNSVPK